MHLSGDGQAIWGESGLFEKAATIFVDGIRGIAAAETQI
jgi:hypothetical protein